MCRLELHTGFQRKTMFRLLKKQVKLLFVLVVCLILINKVVLYTSNLLEESAVQKTFPVDVEIQTRNYLGNEKSEVHQTSPMGVETQPGNYPDDLHVGESLETQPSAPQAVTPEAWTTPEPIRTFIKPVTEPPLLWSYESPKLTGEFPSSELSLPGVYTNLPHLKGDSSLLYPAVSLSKGKTNVSIVIGIPNIRRPHSIYLYDTLKSLLGGLTPAEMADTLIIVCVTEPWNMTYVDEVKENLQRRFPTELDQGLLELIAPKPGFYPDLSNLPQSLDDEPERIKWRTKQNLDYSFLMMHAWSRGQYYLQLEDDVQAAKNYITSIKKAIATNSGDWVVLEFSKLGFIGRLFHASIVPQIAEFLLMFREWQPCDWLMFDFLRIRRCGLNDKRAKCSYKIKSVARSITPSLFQHLGYRSSLKGAFNDLKDNHYGTGKTEVTNPFVSNIFTTLQSHANDIYDAYTGDTIFWATSPKKDDIIEFMYNPPITLKRIIIKTGTTKHPKDILTNAVVEVLPVSVLSEPSPLPDQISRKVHHSVHQTAWRERSNTIPSLKNWAKNAIRCETAFVQVGSFDSSGQVDISLPPKNTVGAIWSLRIRTLATSKKWVVFKKITLTVPAKQSNESNAVFESQRIGFI